ncbi:MAG: hypothetical protein OZ917_04690 [Candidatus Brocadiaceae bacterium]|nr:hypothetical protein [Candidatus Brocadiaceae bacterium]
MLGATAMLDAFKEDFWLLSRENRGLTTHGWRKTVTVSTGFSTVTTATVLAATVTRTRECSLKNQEHAIFFLLHS